MRNGDGSFISFDGLGIFFRSWLPDGDPPVELRGVVMLIHGLAEHSGRYEHVAAAIADAGFGVYALDLRGHGCSGGRRPFVKSYEEFMRDLAQFRELIEERHPDAPLVVLGHSMGGNLAVGHTLEAQDGVVGLALSGPGLRLGDGFSPARIRIGKLLAKVAPAIRPEGLDAKAISRDPAVVQEYVDDPLVFHGKASAGLGIAVIGAMESFPSRYDDLTLPIWIGHGTDDRLADIEGSRALERGAVHADVTAHYYDGLYHEIFNEPEHEQVLADLIAWLERVVPDGTADGMVP